MPKAKKARVEQAEKIEFEQIEDAIEEEAVGSELEAEQEQQPRAPRRMHSTGSSCCNKCAKQPLRKRRRRRRRRRVQRASARQRR